MTNIQFGILCGALLGIAFAFGGFGDMLIVALFGAIGYVIMKVAQGDIDLSDYIGPKGRP